jgi:hypothetical protein
MLKICCFQMQYMILRQTLNFTKCSKFGMRNVYNLHPSSKSKRIYSTHCFASRSVCISWHTLIEKGVWKDQSGRPFRRNTNVFTLTVTLFTCIEPCVRNICRHLLPSGWTGATFQYRHRNHPQSKCRQNQ